LDRPHSDPIDYNNDIQLFAVYRTAVKGQIHYHCGLEGAANFPTEVEVREGGAQPVVRPLQRLPQPPEYPTCTFAWSRVACVRQKFSNERAAGGWDKLAYEELPLQGVAGWSYDVPKEAGVRWYKVKMTVQVASQPVMETPGKDNREYTKMDYRLADEIMRICRKGDYANNYLKFVGSYLECPWIYGSKMYDATHAQPDYYVGTDCADLAIAAWRKMGHNDPYTNAAGLFEKAQKGVYTLVTPRTGDIANVPQPQPGDLIVLRYDPKTVQLGHTVIFVKGGGADETKLSNDDEIIFASAHLDHCRVIKFTWTRYGTVDFGTRALELTVIRLK